MEDWDSIAETVSMEPKTELPLEYETEVRIEEVGGTKIMRIRIPADYQGHTFAIDATPKDGSSEIPLGPYVLRFVLTSEFVLHLSTAGGIEYDRGFSHILVPDKLAQARITFSYVNTKSPQDKRDGLLELELREKRLLSIVVRLPEEDMVAAVRQSSQIVSAMLDMIVLRTCAPVQVRNVDVQCPTYPKFLRRYATIPYSDVFLQESDIQEAVTLPRRLSPAMRLFREAISTSKPHYRFLCLYRAREALDRIRKENDMALVKSGIAVQRTKRFVPDTVATRDQFSSLIGKRVGAFFDYVRDSFRLPIAHGNNAVNDRLELDPADVRTDHRVDAANSAMIQLIKQGIQDERDLMSKHDLR